MREAAKAAKAAARASILFVSMSALAAHALADVVHLKKGGRIEADSVRIEGDRLVIETAAGTMTIPREDVASIEKTSPKPAASAPRPGKSSDPVPPGPPVPAPPGSPAPAPQPPQGRPAPQGSVPAPDASRTAGADSTERSVTDWVTDGIEALAARRYERARSSFLAALAMDPRSTAAALGVVVSQLGAGDPHGARSRAAVLVAEHPDSSQGWFLLGQAEYELGNLAEARRAFEKSRSIEDKPELGAWIERVQAEEKASKGYGSLWSGHFRLQFDPASAPQRARQSLAFLDSIYEEMAGLFGHHPSAGLDVVLHPRDSFSELTGFGDEVLGIYDGKIRIPTGGPDELTSSDRSTFRHELAHAFIASKTQGRCPRWLHEGLAQRAEAKSSRGMEGALVAAAADEAALGGEFTYGSALGFVDYLVERYGAGRMLLLLDKLATEPRLDEAMRWSFGAPFADLVRDWGKAFRARAAGGR